jgi:hypothetical protein
VTIQLSRRTVVIALAGFVTVAVAAFAALGLTLTRTADASHRFNDVGTGTFFHDSTAWLKDNGIADGYGDGTFRTGGNITRGQAAYWFGNYNNGLEVVSNSFDPQDNKGGVSGFVECPAGKRAIAGGGNTTAAGLYIKGSYPDSSTTWTVDWRTDDGVLVSPAYAEVWALCAPETLTG